MLTKTTSPTYRGSRLYRKLQAIDSTREMSSTVKANPNEKETTFKRRRLYYTSNIPEADRVNNMLQKIMQEKAHCWNFDFATEVPHSTGKYEWQITRQSLNDAKTNKDAQPEIKIIQLHPHNSTPNFQAFRHHMIM